MEENPTRTCELTVGLGTMEVLSADDEPGEPLVVHVRMRARLASGRCGGPVWSRGASPVSLVDLSTLGGPVRLMRHK